MEKLSRRSQLPQIELLKLISKLPPAIQDAYLSVEMIDVLENIANRYKFNEEEAQELSGIIYDILLGFLPFVNINNELNRRLNLDGDKLNFVRGELDAFILNRIHNDLNKHYGNKTDKDASLKDSDQTSPSDPDAYSDQKIPDPYREPIG